MKDKILVAVDGSENALQALKEAVNLAKALPAKIMILNVQPSFQTFHTKLFINEDIIRDYQNELFENATKSAIEYLKATDVEYEVKLLIGDPVQKICQYADEVAPRFIFLGSRGLGMIKKTVLGSVSNGVLHETKTPILIIPLK
jgi:nucleotide-binding universal stress UspA family protein